MGQTQAVAVYRLYTQQSIETHMAESAAGKREMAEALMELGKRGQPVASQGRKRGAGGSAARRPPRGAASRGAAGGSADSE